MPKKEENEAYKKLTERNKEVYRSFEKAFQEQVASGEPEDGISRIQLLEQMVHRMNSDILASNMKYVGGMIEALNEDEIIESKKDNS